MIKKIISLKMINLISKENKPNNFNNNYYNNNNNHNIDNCQNSFLNND